MKTKREDVRNIAIIAHVDHGKTTLVDELLKQSGVFRENQEVAERVMDSNDIERERGITILSKNTAVHYKGVKINIIDTPGHADFGGEVERVLKMVNGVILVVDAFEGAMPQTKFVLRKALDLNLPVIVCINKIDRPEARPEEVIDEVLELFIDLGASDEQLECPFVYASAKAGVAVLDLTDEERDMKPLFETILSYIPAPEGDPDAPTQVLISTIDYNEYVGRIGIGKVDNGTIAVNQEMVLVNHHDPDKQEKVKISRLYEFDGLNKVEVKEATIGSIVAISGISDISIGDTLCSPEKPEPIPFQKISEPTIAMQFIVNDSPFAGQEGKYVTSRHLRDRLFRELNTDVSLRVEEMENTDSFKVSGRGELHLSVLIENMRREGYEFAVSKAEVLYKTDENGTHELSFRILVNSESKERYQIASKLSDELKTIGIGTTIESVDYSTYMSKLQSGDFDMFIGGWKLSIDPYFGFMFHSISNDGLNYGSYSNSDVDALIDAAYTSVNESDMISAYSNLEAKIADELPYISLLFRKSALLVNGRINGNFEPIPYDCFRNIETWTIGSSAEN